MEQELTTGITGEFDLWEELDVDFPEEYFSDLDALEEFGY